MTALIVLVCVLGAAWLWLLGGVTAGRRWAARAYLENQRRYPSLGHDTWQRSARLSMTGAMLCGPFAWLGLWLTSVTDQAMRSVPVVELHRLELALAAQRREIDHARRASGLAPMDWTRT